MNSVSLFMLPDTRATFQHHYVKDGPMMKIWRRRSDAAARFGKDNSVTVAVHCCAHSLKSLLPRYWKTASMYQDTLERVKEVS